MHGDRILAIEINTFFKIPSAFLLIFSSCIPLDQQIYDPSEKLIYALERRDEYKFEFDSKMTGNYKFCLSLPSHSKFALQGSGSDQFVDLT